MCRPDRARPESVPGDTHGDWSWWAGHRPAPTPPVRGPRPLPAGPGAARRWRREGAPGGQRARRCADVRLNLKLLGEFCKVQGYKKIKANGPFYGFTSATITRKRAPQCRDGWTLLPTSTSVQARERRPPLTSRPAHRRWGRQPATCDPRGRAAAPLYSPTCPCSRGRSQPCQGPRSQHPPPTGPLTTPGPLHPPTPALSRPEPRALLTPEPCASVPPQLSPCLLPSPLTSGRPPGSPSASRPSPPLPTPVGSVSPRRLRRPTAMPSARGRAGPGPRHQCPFLGAQGGVDRAAPSSRPSSAGSRESLSETQRNLLEPLVPRVPAQQPPSLVTQRTVRGMRTTDFTVEVSRLPGACPHRARRPSLRRRSPRGGEGGRQTARRGRTVSEFRRGVWGAASLGLPQTRESQVGRRKPTAGLRLPKGQPPFGAQGTHVEAGQHRAARRVSTRPGTNSLSTTTRCAA